MPDGSPTRFWHQVRDQALHVLLGAAIVFLWLGLYTACNQDPHAPALWIGVGAATIYTVLREFVQWGHLNTPSLIDSALDSACVVMGAALSTLIYMVIVT